MSGKSGIHSTEQLQFLRFIGFFLIFVFHTGWYQLPWFPKENGAVNAVEFFIVLSGTVSAISSFDKDINFDIKSIRDYVWKKLKKFYPLYFVTTIVAIMNTEVPKEIAFHLFRELKTSLFHLGKCLLLIQSWFPTGTCSYNGAGWFLSTMMFLYLVSIPLKAIAMTIMKKKNSIINFIVIIIATYSAILFYCYVTRNTNTLYTQYTLPISRGGEFICGISLGYIICLFKNREKRVNGIIFSGAELLVLLIWIKGMYMPIKPWHFRIVHWLLPNMLLLFVFSLGNGVFSKIFRLTFLNILEIYHLNVI